jgi:chromosome segregation ATPase
VLPNFVEGVYLISINRSQKAEAESALAEDRANGLESRLEVSKDLEKTLIQQNARLTSECESIRERIQSAEARMTDIQHEGMALSAQSARLVLERDMLLDKLKTADTQICEAKKEEESFRERSFEHSSHI